MEEVSVGDVVLVGGEVFVQFLIEVCVRLFFGVFGDLVLAEDESFEGDFFEYFYYICLWVWEDKEILEVLFLGYYGWIEVWCWEQLEEIMKVCWLDLYERFKGCKENV